MVPIAFQFRTGRTIARLLCSFSLIHNCFRELSIGTYSNQGPASVGKNRPWVDMKGAQGLTAYGEYLAL